MLVMVVSVQIAMLRASDTLIIRARVRLIKYKVAIVLYENILQVYDGCLQWFVDTIKK